jgi:phage gp29-like protein
MLDASPVAQLSTRLAPAPYVDRFGRVYGSTLTPQVVTDVLQNADAGLMFSLADLCDEIRGRDGHLSAELQKRELRVAGAEWELVPPEGSGESGEMIAKWCSARLREIDSRGALSFAFGDAVASLQGAVFQGRAGLEVVWRAEDGWYVPEGLYFIHPRRFAFSTDFAIHLWDASGTAVNALQPMSVKDSPFGEYPGIALARFPRGKFIVHQPRVRGVYPTREGLGVLLVWWCTFKRFGVRDFLAFAEWAGRGLRVGYFATGRGPLGEYQATPEDQQVLQQVLDAMSSSNSAVFADTTKPEIINSPTNNDVHSNLIALCNSEISKAVVGGTLGSEPGARGARSLGEVHERNELMIARADAAAVGSTLVRDLVAPMVALNFGRNAPVPRFRFAVDPAQDLDKMSERIERFVNNGGEIAQADARNLLNLPDPSPGAPLLVPTSGPNGGSLPGRRGAPPSPPAAPAVPSVTPPPGMEAPPNDAPLERPVVPPTVAERVDP